MYNQKNILTLQQAKQWRDNIKNNNKTIIITNGCFDILHRGHISYLNEAKKYADYLLVLLNSDQSIKRLKGQNRPIITQNDRAYNISNLKAVDKVVIFNNKNCSNQIDILKPDLYCKASDYNINNINNFEYQALVKNSVKIIFLNLVQNISTTNIIKKIKG